MIAVRSVHHLVAQLTVHLASRHHRFSDSSGRGTDMDIKLIRQASHCNVNKGPPHTCSEAFEMACAALPRSTARGPLACVHCTSSLGRDVGCVEAPAWNAIANTHSAGRLEGRYGERQGSGQVWHEKLGLTHIPGACPVVCHHCHCLWQSS